MLILATALVINLGTLFGHQPQPVAPTPTCHIRVVSHKFIGAPSTPFTYAGEQFMIPNTGWIELISEKGADSYVFNGRTLPLNVFPLDQFGAETIHIPRASAVRDRIDGEPALMSSR